MSSSTEFVEPSTRRGIAAHLKTRDNLLFLAFALPNIALLVVFTYRPLVDNIRLSFTDWSLASRDAARWVGLANYREFFSSDSSWRVLTVTLVFTVCAVVVSMVLGLALAMLLDQKLAGRNLVRSAVFAPFVLSGAAIGLAFYFVFNPQFGMVASVLSWFGIAGGPDFYQRPGWALFMVTFTYIWKNLGYTFVIYLAALQGLSRDLDEAAAIDGTPAWRKFWRVTMPQLRPATFFLSITVLLGSLQVFDILNIMFPDGGPEGGTTTMVFDIYWETFRNQRAGYGATVATVMFLILLVVTAVQVRMMDRGDK
ncbi:sugar ABC transporter permease [Tsukamurella sp. 8F]|uniref:carbohydrate ABC transporter permease n=1 Tax=unclassified Tsukamurella TaxID=2633480 RepID=UPI0023B99390|nr:MULTISPECIES: sugar ABC transporter permease [unclassified Tsukamurella]MDF0528445.1 sugar ABC transporter permease [Tsukamurella sp. 8J]MDF0586270.1 sugar ABC transporter permease [Tsukamurella sp. 8F]